MVANIKARLQASFLAFVAGGLFGVLMYALGATYG